MIIWKPGRVTAGGMALAVLLVTGGCSENAEQTNQATLEVAEIRGIGFNDPLPADSASEASEASPAAPAEDDSSEISLTPPSENAPASASDIPADIAQIPSATPVPETPAPVPTEIPEVAQAAAAPAASGEYQQIPFKVLSGYKYIEPIPQEGERPEEVEQRRESDQIPDNIKALDGTNAIVEGWMVPMEINDDGSVKSFVLVNTQPECCFGDMQAMNEWVDVIMKPGANAEFNVDLPVKVYGQLEVGEKTEDGFVLSIYRMKADRVEI